jgi:hypothetical protein
LKADIEARQSDLRASEISVAERELAVNARETEVDHKVQALAGMASILNIR